MERNLSNETVIHNVVSCSVGIFLNKRASVNGWHDGIHHVCSIRTLDDRIKKDAHLWTPDHSKS